MGNLQKGVKIPFQGAETKRPNPKGWARKCRSRCRLPELCDLVGLGSFLSLDDLELYRVAFLQGLESFTLDGRVMNEDISSAVLANKTISFTVVEPLDLSLKSCHFPSSFACALGLHVSGSAKKEKAEDLSDPRPLNSMTTFQTRTLSNSLAHSDSVFTRDLSSEMFPWWALSPAKD
jgi:hypothetical protein